MLGLAFNGAGAWSLDAAIGWDVTGVVYGLGALAAALVGAAGVLAGFCRRHALDPAPSGVA